MPLAFSLKAQEEERKRAQHHLEKTLVVCNMAASQYSVTREKYLC